MIIQRLPLKSLGIAVLSAATLFGASVLEFGAARADLVVLVDVSPQPTVGMIWNEPDNSPPAPVMTVAADDIANLQSAIMKCWNIGAMSTRAQQVALLLRVEIDAQGKPKHRRITMTSFSGGEEDAVEQAYQAARRAVIRSQKGCGGKQGFAFDPAKYALLGAIEMTFDSSGMRLR